MRHIILLFALALIALLGCGIHWLESSEESCWKYEANMVFNGYGNLKTRSAVLSAADATGREILNSKSNPVEIIESDPNGCSLGSNGQTIAKIYFDSRHNITKIQVYKNYIASNYKMELVEEREY